MIFKILNSKFVLFFLRKFTKIKSIHWFAIKDYYNTQTVVDDSMLKIVHIYSTMLAKTRTLPIEKFYVKFVPDENKSYIIFEHKKTNFEFKIKTEEAQNDN